ncbi:exonuclease, RNase T and DNA polymerase III [Laribacter hongkongensis HLHK9]|uniref:Exonuclease, RNase T and DNA polymerase III n=1 Tax=Laribacter hongkongensis (strain HLHK9) TaxID=557598 RepID=C1D876_LARHH|nr:3'-5' exonuclease [Laribacter hongkongensis]ACO74666.1 exonuclease, RNase T and DNA polymerase III [Laribacter hongkongensis HLHK9]
MKPLTRICIDLETLGTRTDAPVISIGAVLHNSGDPFRVGAFYASIDIQSACCHGRPDGDTIAWWLKQPDAARMALFDNPQPASTVIESFSNCLDGWLYQCEQEHREVAILANGPAFDLSILARQFRRILEKPLPWKYWQERDYRTERDALVRVLARMGGYTELPPRTGTNHNALDDAVWQVQVLETLQARIDAGIERMGAIVARSAAGEVTA